MTTDRTQLFPPTLAPQQSFVPPPPPAAPQGPSKFARVLGGIAGGALNLVFPGAGAAIGGIVGGGPDYAGMEAMLERSAQQQMRMLGLQTQVQNQTQEFTTITNLLKARHDGEMAAVHNLKS